MAQPTRKADDEVRLITVTEKPRKYWSAHKVLYAAQEGFPQSEPGRPPGRLHLLDRPWTLELYPTMACQIQCVHCYAQERNEEYGFAPMPLKMMESLHESVHDMGIRGVQYCGGGEPLLWRKGAVVDFIAGLPGERTRACMASNMVNGHALARPDVLANMAFVEVAVFAYDDASYDVVAGRKGCHHRVEDAVRAVLAARDHHGLDRPSINAKILVNNRNYTWLPQIYDWAVGVGFDNIHLRLVDDYEGLGSFILTRRQRDEFRSSLTDFAAQRGLDGWGDQIEVIMGDKGASGDHRQCWTVAMGLNAWVLANGEVYVCGPQWGNKDYCIGNLNDARLEDLWGSGRHRVVAERLIEQMATTRCFEMGCRHIKQTIVIDSYLAGDVAVPPPGEFDERHSWFL